MGSRVGRTIGEARERLETANERAAARKKDKRRQTTRLVFAIVIFLALVVILVFLYFRFFKPKEEPIVAETPVATYEPTVEIIDENASTGEGITTRMREYIGQAEADFKDLGYTPTKVVIPTGSIREVDFYLDGHPGFIKMITDRDTAVSIEDADRMLRYLAGQGITDFSYIDVRIDGKAYWK